MSKSNKSFVYQLAVVSIPNSVQEALANTRLSNEWRIEIVEEECTCEIMDLPAGKKLVGCKWLYIVKYKADGMGIALK